LKLFAIAALAAGLTLPMPAAVISSPDASYLGSTTYIDISSLTLYDNFSSITDGSLTVSFSIDGNRRGAPGSGWATWSQAPDSQRAGSEVLPVLSFSGSTLTMTLSTPVSVFGFEAEPDSFDVYNMTADFYYLGSLVGSTTRGVNGSAGARLFAMDGGPFDQVVFSTTDSSFAAGAFRYSGASAVPEPSSMLLLAGGLIGLAVLRRRK
jgi:hypothetical protein